MKREVEEAIQNRKGVRPRVHNIKITGEGLVVELTTFQNKITIMKGKKCNTGKEGITIIDNQTRREQEVQE